MPKSKLNQRHWRAALLVWLIFSTTCVIFASPWIYEGLRSLGDHLGWGRLAQVGYGTVVERTLLLIVVPGVILILWFAGWRKWSDYGLSIPWWQSVPWGASLAIASVLSITIFQIGIGAREFKQNPSWVAPLNVLPAAVAVAFIEEVLFRGVILRLLSSKLAFWTANLTQSFFYAFLHFLSPEGFGSKHQATWTSGFDWMIAVVAQFANFHELTHSPALWIKFANLTLLGWIMGLSTRACGHLGWAIGFHFGAVWTLLTIRQWTDAERGWWRPWIGREVIESVDVLIVAVLLVFVQQTLSKLRVS